VSPTKEQHDAVVEIRQRPYTDRGMRRRRPSDEFAAEFAGLTIAEEYVASYRKAQRHA
jgi:hypothetical protein